MWTRPARNLTASISGRRTLWRLIAFDHLVIWSFVRIRACALNRMDVWAPRPGLVNDRPLSAGHRRPNRPAYEPARSRRRHRARGRGDAGTNLITYLRQAFLRRPARCGR